MKTNFSPINIMSPRPTTKPYTLIFNLTKQELFKFWHFSQTNYDDTPNNHDLKQVMNEDEAMRNFFCIHDTVNNHLFNLSLIIP